MADLAEKLFEDGSVSGEEAEVDEAIRLAGGERQAVRALLIALGEARAAYHQSTSLGYRRGRQPARPA